ncbi:hypothetical protein C8R31_106159 [Nitrosospira sp. Nsp2]|nr:hypothetical protein [Nitrosospira sp. Nsp2]PTR14486.1 hypothetical protein C8R31_106159 [Nitrosospira sp. Nsp2]
MLVDVIRYAVGGELGQDFSPCQRGALARNEQCGLAPDRDMVQTERSFTMGRGFLDVHVQAERAAVDLRCPDIHQIMNRLLDRGVP